MASNDVVEGLQSDRITVTDLGFWVAGSSGPRVRISEDDAAHQPEVLRWADGGAEVGLGDLVSDSGSVNYAFRLRDYGFIADGRWHHVSIPIADFVALGVQLDDPSLPCSSGRDTPEGSQIGSIILPEQGGDVRLHPHPWPDGLHESAIDTGGSASTRWCGRMTLTARQALARSERGH